MYALSGQTFQKYFTTDTQQWTFRYDFEQLACAVKSHAMCVYSHKPFIYKVAYLGSRSFIVVVVLRLIKSAKTHHCYQQDTSFQINLLWNRNMESEKNQVNTPVCPYTVTWHQQRVINVWIVILVLYVFALKK